MATRNPVPASAVAGEEVIPAAASLAYPARRASGSCVEVPGRRPSLLVNAVSNWTVLAVNVAIGLFLTPFIIRHLGKDGYGMWSLLGSIVGYYGLLHLGVANAITPYAARYIGRRDWNGLNEVANTAMAMFTTIAVVVLVASFALATPLSHFFRVAPHNAVPFRWTIWLLGTAAALSFPNKVQVSVLRAYENYVASNTVVIGSSLLRALLTVVLLRLGMGLVGAALAILIADLTGVTANMVLCHRYATDVRFHLSRATRQMLRGLLVYGGTSSVIVLADIVRFNIDSVVIGKFVSLEAVGVYAIAAALVRYASQSMSETMKVLKPRFAQLDGVGDADGLKRTFLRALVVSSTLAFGGAALLVIIGKPLIVFWVGRGFLDAYLPLAVLIGALAFDFAQNPAVNVLYALDRIRLLAVVYMSEAILNLVLSLILVHPYGMLGVAIGTAIPCLLVRLFVLPVLAAVATGVPLASYYGRMLPVAGTAAVVVLLTVWQ
jgi:O-antigen/teichoic acid export membrane protein